MITKYAAVLLLLVVVAGCDSQQPSLDQEDLVLRAIPDTTLYVGELPFVLDLSQFLTQDALDLSYTVRAEGSAILLQRESNLLTIRPLAVGTSTLTVTFSDNARVQESFDVEVLCATATGPGRKGYFPHEVGQSWKYTYSREESTLSGYATSFTGTQTWTVQEVIDGCDQKTIQLAIVSEGDYQNFAAPQLSAMDTTIYDLVTAIFTGRKVFIPRVTYEDVGLEWFQTPDAPRVVQKEDVWGFPSNRLSYDVEQDVGIVHYSFNSAQTLSAYSRIELTLIR